MNLNGVLRNRTVVITLIIVFFILLAMIMTRPVLLKSRSAVPINEMDPLYHTWTLDWDLHALSTNPFGLFNANIFYPNSNTLAYSESQVANAILAAPLFALTGNPVQSTNLLLVFHFFLCSLGAFLLVVHLTGNRVAGVAAGIAYAYAPFKLFHLQHLTELSAGWIPLTFLFFHLYCSEKKARYAFLGFLFFTIQALSCWYYGIMLAFALLLFFLVRLIWHYRDFTLRWTAVLVAAAIVAGIVITPFAVPYFKVRAQDPELTRGAEEVDLFSADVRDFLAAPEWNLVWGKATGGLRKSMEYRAGWGERTIFPGLIVFLLGLFGAVYLFRRGKGEERFSAWFYSALVVVSAVLCLGTSLYVFGRKVNLPMPYDVLFRYFPGFQALRVPPRFAILTALGLAVLGGYAVRELLSRAKAWRGGGAYAICSAVVIILLLVELMTTSIPMVKVPLKSEFPRVYRWLKEQKGEAPTVEIPVASYNPRTFETDIVQEYTYVLFENRRPYYSSLHWKKILNGVSSFVPRSYYDAVYASRDFPSAESLEFYRRKRIKYVIVHGEQLETCTLARTLEWARYHPDFKLVKRFGSDYVFELRGSQGES